MSKVDRAWGTYEVLHTGDEFAVKELHIFANKSLSNQWHTHRDEVWNCVEGEVMIRVSPVGREEEEEVIFLQPQQTYRIPKGWWHKATNPSYAIDAKVVEIWFGKILDESDITREAI